MYIINIVGFHSDCAKYRSTYSWGGGVAGGGIGESPQREELLRPLPRRLEMVRLLATMNVLPTDCEVMENDNIVLLQNEVIQKYFKIYNRATPFCIPRV